MATSGSTRRFRRISRRMAGHYFSPRRSRETGGPRRATCARPMAPPPCRWARGSAGHSLRTESGPYAGLRSGRRVCDCCPLPAKCASLPSGGLEYPGPLPVDWLPDGERFVFNANEPRRPERIFVQSRAGSLPEPVTPEGVSLIRFANKAVSPDGKWVVGIRDGAAALYPLGGGDAQPIRGLLPDDEPTQWSSDGKALYVQRKDSPGKIWLLDRSSGQRRLFKELRPPDTGSRPGIGHFWGSVLLSRDGQSYVHTYTGWLSDLFVLEGLK